MIKFFDTHGEIWSFLKVAISSKPETSCQPKLIQSTVQKENLAIFESSGISETKEATPTKFGVHACYTNAYLYEFFELIPID